MCYKGIGNFRETTFTTCAILDGPNLLVVFLASHQVDRKEIDAQKNHTWHRETIMEVGSIIKNSTKIQHVLCSTDNNFAQHCGVMMCSLFSVGVNTHYVVHILEAGLSDENKQKLTSVRDAFQQEVIFHHVDERFSKELKVHQDCNVSDAAYYRLYVSSIITDISIEKILYLDCDVVINRDISDIFAFDMTDYYVAAVRDVKNPIRENHQLSIGFSYRDRYFN